MESLAEMDLLSQPERAADLPRLGLCPADVMSLPREALPSLLAELAALQTAVAGRLAEAPGQVTAQPTERDALISVEAGARIAGVTPEQLRRRKAFKTARVKLGHRTLRVNELKLRNILNRLSLQ